MAQEHVSNSNEGFDFGGAHQLADSLADPLDDEADDAQVVQDSDQSGDEDDAAQGLDDEDVDITAPQTAKDEVQAVSATVQKGGNAIGQGLQSLCTNGNLNDDECDDELGDHSLDDGHPGDALLVPGQQEANAQRNQKT